jgi:hypothetical protein
VNGENPSLHPCFYFSDRTCTPYVSPCNPSHEYESIPPTASSQAVCSNLTVCFEDEYEGQAPTITTDRVCELVSESCEEQFEWPVYEFLPPTMTSDRVCFDVTDCSPWEIETVPPTPSSDRVCLFCPAGSLKLNDTVCELCPAGSYVPNASQSSVCDDFACPNGSTDHDYNSSTPCFSCGLTASQTNRTGSCPSECLPGSAFILGMCVPCPDESFSLGGNAPNCTPWTRCTGQSFEVSPPSMSSDRTCEGALACVCLRQ